MGDVIGVGEVSMAGDVSMISPLVGIVSTSKARTEREGVFFA